MSESIANGRVTLHCGDMLDILKTLPDCSVDSVVTDPPYHLTSIVKRFGKEGSAPPKEALGEKGAFNRSSRGFMGCKWDAPDEAVINPGFAHWFAGFVDGEGCFSVHKKHVNGCETFDCQFSITLRADDKPIIKDIQKQLGGIGTIADRPAPKSSENSKPQVRYCISSQKDCQRLREILSVFPLRAKKARDFEIWCHALDAWLSHEPGDSWEDVAYFRQALMDVRQYGSQFHPSQLWAYRWAREVYRVLKPGGYLVAFNGTRTYHRMACAIEDSGFEIRDCLAWIYGSGFPKSHNVRKQIERKQFHDWLDAHPNVKALYHDEIKAAKNDTQRAAIELKYRTKADLVGEVISTTTRPDIRNSSRAALLNSTRDEDRGYMEHVVTAPATELAAQWDGWGTALKPALEPICLARKPLIGTVVENVLAHGTGALNVDGCRVPGEFESGWSKSGSKESENVAMSGKNYARDPEPDNANGRWPANVLHDSSAEVVGMFPETAPASAGKPRAGKSGDGWGITATGAEYDDNCGSAARFFYTAKADADDRLGSRHPTVKPLDLMQWLVRLVTPPGGTVLDCFAGTGTTGEAAFREGFNAILIEREPEYQADIRRRMSLVLGGLDERRRESIKAAGKTQDAGPLFAGLEL